MIVLTLLFLSLTIAQDDNTIPQDKQEFYDLGYNLQGLTELATNIQ